MDATGLWEGSAVDPTGPQPGQLTILVIDDDEGVRDFVAEALDMAGYHVLAATRGEEALAALDDAQNEVSLAVLDRNLTGMTGLATFAGLRDRKPDLPVILVSGEAEEDALAGLPEEPGRLFFQPKPFTGAALFERIREVLALERTDLRPAD